MASGVPRNVKVEIGDNDSLPLSMREMLASGWGLIYFVIGQLVGIPEIWELSGAQENDLAKATETFYKSQGKKRAQAMQKIMEKYLPGISFAATIGAITYPRIQATARIKNAKSSGNSAGRPGTPGNSSAGSGTTTDAATRGASANDSRNGAESNSNAPGSTSLTRSELDALNYGGIVS